MEIKASQLTEIKHKHNTTKILLKTVTDEQTKTLSQLQTTKPYLLRFEQLDNDFNEQSQNLAKLKVELQSDQEDLTASIALSDKRKLKLSEYEQEAAQQEKELYAQKQLNKEKDIELDELSNIQSNNSNLLKKVEQLSKAIEESTEKQKQQTEELERLDSIEIQNQALDESISTLGHEKSTLQADHEKLLNQLEQEKVVLQNAHDELANQFSQEKSMLQTTCDEQAKELKALSNMQAERQALQQTSQALQDKLEEQGTELTVSQQEIDTLNNKYTELHEQHSQLIDSTSPNKNHIKQLKKELTELATDNANLVSRLRAISSVVGAVGTSEIDEDLAA